MGNRRQELKLKGRTEEENRGERGAKLARERSTERNLAVETGRFNCRIDKEVDFKVPDAGRLIGSRRKHGELMLASRKMNLILTILWLKSKVWERVIGGKFCTYKYQPSCFIQNYITNYQQSWDKC